MKTLNERIADVTAKHTFESHFINKLDGILSEKEMTLVWSSARPFVSLKFENSNPDTLKKVLRALTPSNKFQEQKHGSVMFQIFLPYKLRIKNPAIVNSASKYLLRIEFMHQDYGVWINIPIGWVHGFVYEKFRKPTPSEMNTYYSGMPLNRRSNFRVTEYVYKGRNSWCSFYGGDKVCIDTAVTNEIMNYLITGEYE